MAGAAWTVTMAERLRRRRERRERRESCMLVEVDEDGQGGVEREEKGRWRVDAGA
jgi:hypothetical protein